MLERPCTSRRYVWRLLLVRLRRATVCRPDSCGELARFGARPGWIEQRCMAGDFFTDRCDGYPGNGRGRDPLIIFGRADISRRCGPGRCDVEAIPVGKH